MDDLRHRMENLERRVKEIEDDNKLLLSQLKHVNKLNDLLIIQLNKIQVNNGDLSKSNQGQSGNLFLYDQSQFLERINKLKEISKSLNKLGPF